MNVLRLLPVLLSALLLAAHFLRSGMMPLVILSLAFPFVLLVPRPWAARLVQVVLIAGALEWARTVLAIAGVRQNLGDSWARMAVILGSVALVTLASTLVFRSRALRERYRLQ